MARISEDLLTEILSRLPVKSLMQLKCVSKRWYSLISNPSFAKLHLRRATKTDYYASCKRIVKCFPTQCIDYEAFDTDDNFNDGKEAVRLLSFPSYDPEEDWGILIGSCDGLVCLALDSDFILCNPCTGKLRKFQNSGLIPREEIDVVSDFWGFGYDYTSHDYKILHGATFSDISKETIAVVFSLKNNSWRRISHENADGAFDGGVYLNGALHWYVRRKDADHELDTILSFDFADEKFKNVLPTPKADDGFLFEDLGVHDGHLFIYSVTWKYRCEAWIMKEHGNGSLSWIKWFDVSTDGLPGCKYYIKVIARTKSGKIVCQIDERELIVYNPEDRTFKDIPVELNDGFQPMTTYIESLVSPFD